VTSSNTRNHENLPKCCILFLLISTFASSQATPGSLGWPTYGGDAGGQRYSSATQITPANVDTLRPIWQYHTRALDTHQTGRSEAAFEATPILEDRSLFFTTPFDQVIALDAVTGAEQWRYDPKLPKRFQAGVYTSRGVAYWKSNKSQEPCADRIFVATLDGRLIALDGKRGTPCSDFGASGTVDLKHNLPTQTVEPYKGYGVTSPPTVVGDVVVVGSAVADGQEVDVEPGIVRGFDVRSGKLLWTWDPMPWAMHQAIRTGGGNTWSIISADPEHGLIYLPTGSPSPDFYGGMRPGNDGDADSVVALDSHTGQKVWSFQVVHHNLWDYDVASEPLLFEYQNRIPAVAVTTKMGMIFLLNRLTGAPIYPIEERPVPQSDVPGEHSSPTQPFSTLPPLSPLSLRPDDLAGHTSADANSCAAQISALRNEGIYTPPSLRGSLLYPGSLGGVNWGSPAFDPETGTLYVNSNHHAFRTRLVPRWRFELDQITGSWENWAYASLSLFLLWLLLLLLSRKSTSKLNWIGGLIVLALAGQAARVAFRPAERQHFGTETAPQRKTPYAVERAPLTDSHGLPCTPMPWGKITALNLNTGTMQWERPLGTMVKGAETGSLNLGGPIVTHGGLIFVAAVREPVLRAYDKTSGNLVWTGQLPVPAQSTPMTYEIDGKQYVVIAAGGHGGFGTPQGDSLVAFALP
jgi:quinoprotein glucose dehydrogenase